MKLWNIPYDYMKHFGRKVEIEDIEYRLHVLL